MFYDADLPIFFQDFSQIATHIKDGQTAISGTQINVLFDAEYNATTIDGAVIEGVSPRAHLIESSAPAIAHGDTILIAGKEYIVIEIRSDGAGLLTLELSEDKINKKQFSVSAFKTNIGICSALIAGEGQMTDNWDYAIATSQINMIRDSGVKLIRIGASYDAWWYNNTVEQQRCDTLIQLCKTNNLEIFLWDWQYSAYLNANKVSWADYKNLHLQWLDFFIQRWQPQHYCIATEFTATLFYMCTNYPSVVDYLTHIAECAAYIRSTYPAIKLSVLATPGDYDYDDEILAGAINIADIDIIGIELYNSTHIAAYKALAKQYNLKQYKQVWLLETWDDLQYPTTSDPDRQRRDIAWIENMFELTKQQKLEGLMVWPWIYFQTYDPTFVTNTNFNLNQKTSAYNKFVELKDKYAK